MLIDLPVAGAVLPMIVDDPAGLQMGIDRYCSQILEAVCLQLLCDLIRQAVTDRNTAVLMPHIQDRFSTRMRPEPVTEAAMFPADFPETLSVIDNRFDLSAGTDHTFRVHNAIDIRIGIISDPIIVKAVKAFPEDLPFLQHQTP